MKQVKPNAWNGHFAIVEYDTETGAERRQEITDEEWKWTQAAAPDIKEMRRRYEAKRRTFEDATPREYCETCLFFCAGTGDDPDLCMEEPTAEDTTTDSRQVITNCKLYKAR